MTKSMTRAHRAPVQVGAKRPPLRILRQPSLAVVSHEHSAAVLYDEFGQRLHLIGCILTDDADLAQMLVIQTIVARAPEPCTIQELSAGVYVAWMAWGNPPITRDPVVSTDTDANDRMLGQIRQLPADQRAALGLCKFGGHTYRGAAAALGLAPDRVALLLRAALRALAPLPAA